jgi:Xaa-Pro aminopeptidase
LELEALKRAAKIATVGMKAAVASCKPGVRECEVAGEAERAMRVMGAEGFVFSTIVSSGVNSSMMQDVVTTKRIRKGEAVLIDLGATVGGYNSEFTRTVFVGKPKSLVAKAYMAVSDALRRSIMQLRDGVVAGDIDSKARQILSSHKVPGYRHHTGHGLGTGAMERPWIGAESKELIRANMVIALEPASYLPGIGGVRLEDNLVVTSEGVTILTKAPFEERAI